LKKVLVTIIQHTIIEWKCTNCNKMNQKTVYTKIDGKPLECNYCGKIFKGYMILGQ